MMRDTSGIEHRGASGVPPGRGARRKLLPQDYYKSWAILAVSLWDASLAANLPWETRVSPVEPFLLKVLGYVSLRDASLAVFESR